MGFLSQIKYIEPLKTPGTSLFSTPLYILLPSDVIHEEWKEMFE